MPLKFVFLFLKRETKRDKVFEKERMAIKKVASGESDSAKECR